MTIINPQNNVEYKKILAERLKIYQAGEIEFEPVSYLKPADPCIDEDLVSLTHENRALWAEIRYDYANSLLDHQSTNRLENIEKAIIHFQKALDGEIVNGKQIYGFTKDEFPEEWAAVQSGLGQAHEERIKGGQNINIRNAIQHYQNALEIYTEPKHPIEWANLQNNLGIAYAKHAGFNIQENRQKAIEYYRNALQKYIALELNNETISTHFNLFNLGYVNEDLLDLAIEFYHEKLTEFSSNQTERAMFHNALGRSYFHKKIYQHAINHQQQALEFYKQHTHPIQWAMTHHQLGLAYEGLHTTSMNSK
ncbi:MAG: hypothetical protein B6242_11585 [Anaerolineaceae bacterium 4572_78]|nr:MAG: hypothetical protein B6242_11585 [Anaerolineaceae bacterium 4572_78]